MSKHLRPTLALTLSQRLVMTPSLLQKIELLTLNRLELSDLLNQELGENPVLEEIVGQGEVEGAEGTEEKEKSDDTEGYEDFDYEYFFGEYLSPSSRSREWEGKNDQPSFELFLATPSTLNDHLNWQLNLTEVDSEIRDICYFIIGNIDEDGYLILPVEEIAQSLEGSEKQVEEALQVVQRLDPIGRRIDRPHRRHVKQHVAGVRRVPRIVRVDRHAVGGRGSQDDRRRSREVHVPRRRRPV